jgi:hypothetical protein
LEIFTVLQLAAHLLPDRTEGDGCLQDIKTKRIFREILKVFCLKIETADASSFPSLDLPLPLPRFRAPPLRPSCRHSTSLSPRKPPTSCSPNAWICWRRRRVAATAAPPSRAPPGRQTPTTKTRPRTNSYRRSAWRISHLRSPT